jgi:Histone methylation protein DOT1
MHDHDDLTMKGTQSSDSAEEDVFLNYVTQLEERLASGSDELEEVHMEAAIDAMLTSPCAAEEIGGSNTSATPLFSDYTNPNAVENCLSPYVPTKADRIAALVRFARLKPEDVLLDLGSGDGRVCVAASMLTRCRSIGVELSPPCVRMARQLVADEGGDIDCEFIECDATARPQDLLAGTWEAGVQLRYCPRPSHARYLTLPSKMVLLYTVFGT